MGGCRERSRRAQLGIHEAASPLAESVRVSLSGGVCEWEGKLDGRRERKGGLSTKH